MARVAKCPCGWHKSLAGFYDGKRMRCADCGNVVDVREVAVPYSYPPYASWAGSTASPPQTLASRTSAHLKNFQQRRTGHKRLAAAWLVALANLLVVPALRGGPSMALVIGFGILALFLLREAAANLGRHGGVRFSWLALPVIGLLLPVLMALHVVPFKRHCGRRHVAPESVKVQAEPAPRERVWRFHGSAEAERALQHRYRHDRGPRAQAATGVTKPHALGSRAEEAHASQCTPDVPAAYRLRPRQSAAERAAEPIDESPRGR